MLLRASGTHGRVGQKNERMDQVCPPSNGQARLSVAPSGAGYGPQMCHGWPAAGWATKKLGLIPALALLSVSVGAGNRLQCAPPSRDCHSETLRCADSMVPVKVVTSASSPPAGLSQK